MKLSIAGREGAVADATYATSILSGDAIVVEWGRDLLPTVGLVDDASWDVAAVIAALLDEMDADS